MAPALALFVFFGLSGALPDIQPGTHLVLQLETVVSTRTAQPGDPVRLRTASPVIIDGLSIPIGSETRGVVTRSRRPGRVRGRGELEIGIVSIMAPDGTVRPFIARSSSITPPQSTVARARVHSRPPPTLSILAGMAAGYGTAMLVSRSSHSEETIVRSGAAAGLATAIVVGVMKRGEDLVLRPGLTIDVVFSPPSR